MASPTQMRSGNTRHTDRAKMVPLKRPEENRAEPRFRTHLRTGAVSDLQQRFIAECLVCDRSARGARLRLPANTVVPTEFYFLDSELTAPVRVQVRWRRDREIGICVVGVRR